MRVWVVLPAFNEEGNLPSVLQGFEKVANETYKLDIRVIVVDDGSTDQTAEVARHCCPALQVEVLENGKNRGLAATFMRGMIEAGKRAEDDDIIVCMDADNTHLPGLLLQMVNSIREGRDVVVASRFQRGSFVRGVPRHRRVLSSAMAILFRLVYPIPAVRDYSCGYRAYRASLIQEAIKRQGSRLFYQEGFACMVGILLRLHKEGAIFGEVPMVLRYDRKQGTSKMKVLTTIRRSLVVLLKERLSTE